MEGTLYVIDQLGVTIQNLHRQVQALTKELDDERMRSADLRVRLAESEQDLVRLNGEATQEMDLDRILR